MAGYRAPETTLSNKTTPQNSYYTNGKWHVVVNQNLYYEMPLPAVDAVGGFGDGTTEGTIKAPGVGTNNKTHEVGFDRVNNILKLISRSGAVRYETTPYTPGTDTYGPTTATRIDLTGNFVGSGFATGVAALIVDQQGNSLFFAIAIAGQTVGSGMVLSWNLPNDDMVSIDPGAFVQTGDTNQDPFVFNDGVNDYVGVAYADGTGDFVIAYHLTETQANVSNYTTGWIVERFTLPISLDDHVCARSYNGTLYAILKDGGTGVYVCEVDIDTATNNSTVVSTVQVYRFGSRGIIVIDETAEEFYVFYQDTNTGGNGTINYKKQPLVGYSYDDLDNGTVLLSDAGENFVDSTPPSHNVTADMGTFNIFAGSTTWYARFDIGGAPVAATLSNPTTTGETTNSATIGVTSDTAGGTLYWIVDTTATAIEADIKAGTGIDSGNMVPIAGSNSVVATGLASNTAYYHHWVQETTGDSNVIDSLVFSTSAAVSPPTNVDTSGPWGTQVGLQMFFPASYTQGSDPNPDYLWTKDTAGGADGTFDNATILQPTFTLTSGNTGDTVALTLTVTNTDGGGSAFDTENLTVVAPDYTFEGPDIVAQTGTENAPFVFNEAGGFEVASRFSESGTYALDPVSDPLPAGISINPFTGNPEGTPDPGTEGTYANIIIQGTE